MDDIYTSINLDGFSFKIRHIQAASTRGNRKPIVILPGFGGIAEAFGPNVNALYENGYWPMIVENVGFGKSGKPKFFKYNIKNLVLVIYQWIEENVDTDFYIMGTSLGGGVALGVWELLKMRVKALILVAPAGFGRDVFPLYKIASLPMIRDIFVWILYNPIIKLNRGTKSWKSVVYETESLPQYFVEVSDEIKNDGGLRYSYNYILRHYVNIHGQSERLNNRTHRICHRLKSQSVPVQIFWGKHDGVIPLTHVDSVLKHTNGRLTIIEEAGHMPYLERPEKFNTELIKFLNEW